MKRESEILEALKLHINNEIGTQKTAADRLGYNRSYLSQLLNGGRKMYLYQFLEILSLLDMEVNVVKMDNQLNIFKEE